MGKQIYLTDKELDYLESLLDAQDRHDDDEDIAHYEKSKISISRKILNATK